MQRSVNSSGSGVLASVPFHCLVILLGTAFILTGAFHGNIWFDESYSVAIASHSFQEIWRIGSGDVHPVLYYWALHVLYLLFGQNILVYRLFTMAGTVCFSLLGLLIVRRDFGWHVGLLFSTLSLFLPYVAYIAVEIRMYSWASFCVALCSLMAWRIASVLRSQRAGEGEHGWFSVVGQAAWWKGSCTWAGVPCRWWVAFFLSSLAAAYLHYYGVLSAFLINLFLLVFIVKHCLTQRRAGEKLPFAPLGVLLFGAVVEVLLYLPWLLVLLTQVGVVSSGTYWSDVQFPRTLIEWLLYPVYTSHIVFADHSGWQYVVLAYCAGTLAVLALVVAAVQLVLRLRKNRAWALSSGRPVLGRWTRMKRWILQRPGAMAAVMGLLLYFGVLGFAVVASVAMDTLIVYYRYLSVAICGLILAVSVLVAAIPNRKVVGALVVALLAAAITSQSIFVQDAYSEGNQEPLDWFMESLAEYSEEAGAQIPVISTDIGFEGVTSVLYPDVHQVYLDWQQGNWDLAYQAYAPTLGITKMWQDELPGYTGKFILLSQARSNCETAEVAELLKDSGIEMVDTRTYYRQYERTWFTVSVMEKVG